MKYYMAFFLSISALFFLLITPSHAATLSAKQVSDDEKSWTVRFNSPVSASSNWKESIMIMNAAGLKHPASLTRSADGKSVTVYPEDPYLIGESYRVIVSAGLASQSGKKLKENTTLPFSIKGEYIHSVQANLNPLATNVIVQGTAAVGRITVTAGGYETTLHHETDNRFTRGMIGLMPGDDLTVRAYGSAGQLLEEFLYEVKN